jgi:hypothetical protein
MNPIKTLKRLGYTYVIICVGLQSWSFYQFGSATYEKVEKAQQTFARVESIRSGLIFWD